MHGSRPPNHYVRDVASWLAHQLDVDTEETFTVSVNFRVVQPWRLDCHVCAVDGADDARHLRPIVEGLHGVSLLSHSRRELDVLLAE